MAKRKATFAEYQQVQQQQIIQPQSMADYAYDKQVIEPHEQAKQQIAETKVKSLTALDFLGIIGLNRGNKNNDADLFQPQQAIEQLIQEIPKEDVVTKLKAKQVLQNIDTITKEQVQQLAAEQVVIAEDVQEAVSSAVDNIDDFELADIEDLVVTEIKSKVGYTKTKVTVKSNTGGAILSKLATKIKSLSNNVITHRKCDLRLIGNTNKTQLKSFSLKLTKNSYTFKPTGGEVNKGTRVILSLHDDFKSNGICYVYIQKSRDKFIKEIELNESSLDWLANYINEFYNSTFNVAKQRLNLRTESLSSDQEDILKLMVGFTKTKKFEVMPIQSKEDESQLIGFLLRHNGVKNQWLNIEVSSYKSGFVLKCRSKIKRRWSWAINHSKDTIKVFTYEQISDMKKMVPALENLFNLDWKKQFNVDMEEDALEYYDSKLSYRKLRNALEWMFIGIDDEESARLNLTVIDVLSQKDTASELAKNGKNRFSQYKAESIIGKIKGVDYFALSYLAVPEIGTDKRYGGDYITTQQYYEKYSVKDKRQYNQRNNTVLRKQSVERNYNTRKYMFQLEYSIDGKKDYLNNVEFKTVWDHLISKIK